MGISAWVKHINKLDKQDAQVRQATLTQRPSELINTCRYRLILYGKKQSVGHRRTQLIELIPKSDIRL